uniref:CBM21 domain-containing protein n=2 Tax=Macrostomum lignano TaxID=282301 RepID=A0A1I8FU81_9PLAT
MDEGISEPALPQARDSSGCPAGDCGSSSEGYATSQDSLVASSETLSFASEDAPSDEAQKLDSLSLALQELRYEKLPPPQPLAIQTQRQKPVGASKQLQQQRRSSSMKSQKTPPGTPNQMKKVVRFADAFGLDLAYVKHVFDTENPPVIPPQATRDLDLPEATAAAISRLRRPEPLERRLFSSPCFAQPGGCASFMSRVLAQRVVLERASATQPSGRIHGLVRVANLGFEKSVMAHATFDGWRSCIDVPAVYVEGSSTGATDQFSFTLPLPQSFGVGDRVFLCVRYCIGGETFWDNNFGENYAFDCFAVNTVSGGGTTGPACSRF